MNMNPPNGQNFQQSYVTGYGQQPVPPVQQPVAPQNQNTYGQPQQQNDKKTSVWYKPVSQSDYGKIAQIGEVVFVVRFLPSISNGQMFEAISEKDVSTSLYPNAKKWIAPVLVLNDPLHPEKNGTVGIIDMSKSLFQKVKSKKTPQGYFDFYNGFNFNIVVSMNELKDGSGSVYPGYFKSHYDQAPSAVDANYAYAKMVEQKFENFILYAQKLNEYLVKKSQEEQAPPSNQVNQNALQTPHVYGQNVGQVQPQFQQPVQQQQFQQPMQQPVQQQPNVPANTNLQFTPPQQPPQAHQQQAPQTTDQEFEQLFGSPIE